MFSLIYHNIKNRKINELMLNQKLNSYDLSDLQNKKLKSILMHAFRNVPYYRTKYNEYKELFENTFSLKYFHLLPYLIKKEININRNELISKNINKRKLIYSSTSGSTGEALYFYYDRISAGYRRATVERNQSWININYFDKKAVLWGAPNDLKIKNSIKGRISSRLKRKLFLSSYNLSENSLSKYAEKLICYKPRLLVSYPGPLSIFAEYLIEKGIKIPSIRAIISSAETLYQWQKDIIENAFLCPVYNRYGCREFGDIAQECCKKEGLHVNSDRFFLEIVDKNVSSEDEEDIGEILITDLDNYGMPLIRYSIGDVAYWKKSKCSCGMNFPLLKYVEGRTLDIIKAPNGNRLGGTFWTLLLRERNSIKSFQVIQEVISEIIIKYIKTNYFKSEDLEYFCKKIKEKCGNDFKIKFKEVSQIENTVSGKSRIVISKL